MEKPVISVIVPVYNSEKYIKKCLEQIINQTYKNLEIIVVDDGSTDGSAEIIKQFSGIKFVQHSKNQGLSVSRNTGMDHATGKYVHFIDDDDEINAEFYESMLNASEKHNADLSCCSFVNERIYSYSQMFNKEKVITDFEDKFSATYVAKLSFVWRYLFRFDFLKKHNLRFEPGRIVEDIPFSFQSVFYANKIVTIPDARYRYVYNPSSIMSTQNTRIDVDYKHSMDFIIDFAKKNGDFKIPGVSTGKLGFFLHKLKMALYFSWKYRTFKALKL